MKRSGIRKNNRGDSLILVIGCIALLSIVGVILLAKTMDNRSMKMAEEQAQASFAGAESGSAEMVTVLETVTLDVIEDAFEDMLLEYSLMENDAIREDRYKKYFKQKVDALLTADTLQHQLETALGGSVANLRVERGDVEISDVAEEGFTNTVCVKDVEFTYTTAGSQTKITTDICVKAKLPNITAGFNSGISCDFMDFALVSDGNVTTNKQEDLIVTGNMYVGGDFHVFGSGVAAKIYRAKKLLVKNEVKLDGNAGLWVNADGVTISKGEGIWAGGISVNGSTLDTTDMNLYVKDDLAVEGTIPTKVELKGGSAEYVGYSGNSGAIVNHERSSAININECTNLILDLSTLGELYIDGNSYICENNNNWGDGFMTGTTDMKPAEGILQGESVAYKDMQALYLVPGSCLVNYKHNPIIGEVQDENIGAIDMIFKFKRSDESEDDFQSLDLSHYVDNANPYVRRTAHLDGGATVATYVYLNFKDAESAARYVNDYMNTFLGDSIKNQIKNLGSGSKIALPTDTYTLSNAITYDGTDLTMRPAADATGKNLLDIASLLAEQRAKCLFSTLRLDGSTPTGSSYRMVKDGILSSDAFSALSPGGEKEITDGGYKFYAYNGNLTITAGNKNKYNGMQGILLVNGDLTIEATPLNINGLVLVTGEVTQAAGASFTAEKDVVEALLANDEVAKFFRVFGADSGHGYLSTEAVQISFENWKKN